MDVDYVCSACFSHSVIVQGLFSPDILRWERQVKCSLCGYVSLLDREGDPAPDALTEFGTA